MSAHAQPSWFDPKAIEKALERDTAPDSAELRDILVEIEQQSLRAGHIVKIDTPRTIADGAQTQAPGDLTFAIIQQRVNEVLTVNDEQLVQAMRFYAERMKIVVEPTGSLSLAAAIHGGLPLKGKRVGIVISGGNVRTIQLVEHVSPVDSAINALPDLVDRISALIKKDKPETPQE